MTEKVVYDPKEHASNQKNAGTKKPAKAVAPNKPTKATKSKEPADAGAHAKDGADVEESVIEFEAKLNKYGFIHVPKRAWTSLPFGLEKPLMARIEGKKLVFTAATK
jgi:hypothetical protein